MKLLIKVCGMTQGENIRRVEELGTVDLMGFIFYPPSKRFVAQMPNHLPHTCKRTGVFVDETCDTIADIAAQYQLDYLQLHGMESPLLCRQLQEAGYRIIKALPIACADDLKQADGYHGTCDYLLFDTKCAGHGGSGQSFNWNILNSYHGPTPFFLSGGIGPDSLSSLKRFSHPLWAGIDLNSQFETAPGIKDAALLNQFINDLKDISL